MFGGPVGWYDADLFPLVLGGQRQIRRAEPGVSVFLPSNTTVAVIASGQERC
jgi:hypothetical protein